MIFCTVWYYSTKLKTEGQTKEYKTEIKILPNPGLVLLGFELNPAPNSLNSTERSIWNVTCSFKPQVKRKYCKMPI